MNSTPDQQGSGNLAKIFVVTSGKGGVGKTSISVNLCTELACRGKRVILVDADLGLANAHILMGIKPEKSLTDYLEGNAALSEILSTGPKGLRLISGGQGIQEMANLDSTARKRIIDAIFDLRNYCDLILIDTGAGVSNAVTDFVEISDQAIVVTNANFAAIANAYGIIKVMVMKGYTNTIHLVVNRARSTEEAKQVYIKLKGCTQKFLEADLNLLGLIPEDIRVSNALQHRKPFTVAFPDTVASTYLRRIIDVLETHIGTTVAR